MRVKIGDVEIFSSAGAAGTSGINGTSGTSGSSGSSGVSGSSGSSGKNGTSGSSGSSGTSGSAGTSGTSGSSGITPYTTSSIQTTNAIQTTLASIAFGTYSLYSIEANIIGYDANNNLGYASKIYGAFKGISPTYSTINTTDIYEKTDFSTATSDIIVSGLTMSIVVTGEAGKTISWKTQYLLLK